MDSNADNHYNAEDGGFLLQRVQIFRNEPFQTVFDCQDDHKQNGQNVDINFWSDINALVLFFWVEQVVVDSFAPTK